MILNTTKSMQPNSPLVLVTSDVRNIDGYNIHGAIDYYLNALIEGAEVLPLILPALGKTLGTKIEFEALFSRIDGILITGARSNLHPNHYGKKESEDHAPFDPKRDTTNLILIRHAIEQGLPLFCICRGLQELNVALGGSLEIEIHKQTGRFDHTSPEGNHDERFAIRHPIHLHEGGKLANMLEVKTIMVNSAHRQAIGTLSDKLAIEATAEDCTIEAVSVIGAKSFALGVQWHPEYWYKSDPPSHRLFAEFGASTRQWRNQKEKK